MPNQYRPPHSSPADQLSASEQPGLTTEQVTAASSEPTAEQIAPSLELDNSPEALWRVFEARYSQDIKAVIRDRRYATQLGLVKTSTSQPTQEQSPTSSQTTIEREEDTNLQLRRAEQVIYEREMAFCRHMITRLSEVVHRARASVTKNSRTNPDTTTASSSQSFQDILVQFNTSMLYDVDETLYGDDLLRPSVHFLFQYLKTDVGITLGLLTTRAGDAVRAQLNDPNGEQIGTLREISSFIDQEYVFTHKDRNDTKRAVLIDTSDLFDTDLDLFVGTKTYTPEAYTAELERYCGLSAAEIRCTLQPIFEPYIRHSIWHDCATEAEFLDYYFSEKGSGRYRDRSTESEQDEIEFIKELAQSKRSQLSVVPMDKILRELAGYEFINDFLQKIPGSESANIKQLLEKFSIFETQCSQQKQHNSEAFRATIKLLHDLFLAELQREWRQTASTNGVKLESDYLNTGFITTLLWRISQAKKCIDRDTSGKIAVTVAVDDNFLAEYFYALFTGQMRDSQGRDGYEILNLNDPKYRDRLFFISCGKRGRFTSSDLRKELEQLPLEAVA